MSDKRGLPADFDLDLGDDDSPTILGDYLDEQIEPVVKKKGKGKKKPSPTKSKASIKESVEVEEVEVVPEVTPAKPLKAKKTESSKTSAAVKKKRTSQARREITTRPDTEKMFDEIIRHVTTYSIQSDTKSSEIFHAMVLALYQSLKELDLQGLPKRGKWGSPTADAFRTMLSQAFAKAIYENQRDREA